MRHHLSIWTNGAELYRGVCIESNCAMKDFGMPGNSWRIVPGTWVKLRHSRRLFGEWGRVTKVDGPGSFRIETDGCEEVAVARDDIRVKQDRRPPHDWFPMRKTLPYGQYIESDGSRVLFNRDYEPLVRVRPDGAMQDCDRHESIRFDKQEWFYKAETGKPAPWQDEQVLVSCIRMLTDKPQNT